MVRHQRDAAKAADRSGRGDCAQACARGRSDHGSAQSRTLGCALRWICGREGTLKIKITAAVTNENLKTVRKFYGAEALLVLASHQVFMGERQEAEPDNIGELGIPRRPAEPLVNAMKKAIDDDNEEHDADGVVDDDPELPDTTEHAAPDWRKNMRPQP